MLVNEEVNVLHDRVADIASVLGENAEVSERQRRLAEPSVAALRDSGLYRLWWPTCLGGPGLDLADGIAVIEAVAEADTASAWNLAVGTLHDGFAGAYLADHAVADIFARDPIIAGQMAPIGTAQRIDGGLKLSGCWSFGSGIHQADWVLGGALLHEAGSATAIVAVLPAAAAVIDAASWHVAGLAGTGSCDYCIDDAFVPDGYWFGFPAPQRMRGGSVFELSIPAQSLVLHAGFPLGAARRSLREVVDLARRKVRAFSSGTVASRDTFQRDLGEAEARLSAVRLLVYDVARRLQAASSGELAATTLLEARAVTRYATDVAVDMAMWAYRAGGGSVLQLTSPLQRVVRDLLAATQHIYVDESAYTAHGAALLGAAP